MRLLYIGPCAWTINPTSSLVLALLRQCAETVCYGPGFIQESELNAGLEKFLEKQGKFDFYVRTRLPTDLDEGNIRYYHRYMRPDYSSAILRKFSDDVSAYLKRSNVPWIVFLIVGLDPFAISEVNARIVAETNGYFVSWAGGFSKPITELDLLSSERFRPKGRIFGLWHDLVTKYDRKFINLGHFVAETEFDWRTLDSRPNEFVVPGQMYVRRKSVRRKLASHGSVKRTGGFKSLMSLMDHIGLRPHARPLLQSLYNQTFVQSISAARYAYTDGSGYEFPLRKFFEIPALGTVMLCTPCAGFSKLGFSNRKNAVVVEPDVVGDVIEWLRKSPDEAQKIAAAGRELVWRRHSLHARAQQLAQCLKSIVAGRYLGSRWDHGEFVVDENPAALGASQVALARDPVQAEQE